MSRMLVGKIHLVAALFSFTLISAFWMSTVVSELFLAPAAVAVVKQAILWGMMLLVPAMIAVGGTGFRLGGKSTAPVIARKRRRMPVIALNGLLVLVPSTFFLATRAGAGQFDRVFYLVQGIELVAGATNLALMGLNIRDGFAMTRKRRRGQSFSRSAAVA